MVICCVSLLALVLHGPVTRLGIDWWTEKVKDQLEASVCRQVCRGDITLKQGQAIFLDEPDWTKAYLKYFPERG